MAKKIAKRIIKRFSVSIFLVLSVIIFGFVLIFFSFFQEEPDFYVFPEKLKQGDTIFIKIKSEADKITGFLGQDKINFFRKEKNHWISFFGIDAKTKPGNYKILINLPQGQILEKEIIVATADFANSPIVLTKELENKGYTEAKIVENITKKDNPKIEKIFSVYTPEPYFKESFSFPLSDMEKKGFAFGVFIKSAKNQLQHFGVDLKAPFKTEIHAINDGRVVFADDLSNYGKTLAIDHGLGIFSLYLHLNDFKVFFGEMVKKGQIIALSGNSGYSTAPHLHFSIRDAGSRVDPILFIKTTQKTDDSLGLANIAKAIMRLFGVVEN